MSGQDIYLAIGKTQKMMHAALRASKIRGRTLAEKERDYKIAYAQQLVEMDPKKYTPSIMKEIVRGLPEIADMEFEMHVAKVLYESAVEAINVYKKDLAILEEQARAERLGT